MVIKYPVAAMAGANTVMAVTASVPFIEVPIATFEFMGVNANITIQQVCFLLTAMAGLTVAGITIRKARKGKNK